MCFNLVKFNQQPTFSYLIAYAVNRIVPIDHVVIVDHDTI